MKSRKLIRRPGWQVFGLLALLTPVVSFAEESDRRPAELIKNSIGMLMVRIPAGEFMMGTDESPAAMSASYPQYEVQRLQALDDERPLHKVSITRAFYIGKHLVTVGQFARFIVASGHVPESIRDQTGAYGYNPAYDPETTARKDAFEGRNPRYSWRDPGFAQADDHPVVNVSWNDAVALAEWLSQTEKARYRLPTEAEWEYACRAGTSGRYPHGDDPQRLIEFANTFDQDSAAYWPRFADHAMKGRDGFAFTAPVGSFSANAFGLHDMVGNAWQWTADWYSETYYSTTEVENPPGPPDGAVKVRRGGSWHSWALYTRCAFRNWNTPTSRYPLIGIRLVREANQSIN